MFLGPRPKTARKFGRKNREFLLQWHERHISGPQRIANRAKGGNAHATSVAIFSVTSARSKSLSRLLTLEYHAKRLYNNFKTPHTRV